MKSLERLYGTVVPPMVIAAVSLARSKKAQGSLEYIMMIAAASVVIVLALAMVVKLKGAVVNNVVVNGTNMSISQAISKELGSLSSGA